ncbi:MAG: SRPBCC domain-containing protein [Candidatus Limnocylindrales bacterium]|nr:SRPBCC domain-containing protein [Candidatus Limnocylindrales bacterium]
MLLDISKSVTLRSSAADVWAFLREPARVAGCLPSVHDFKPGSEPGRYTTLLVERLGPFQVRIPLTIDVSEDAAGRQIVARVSGDDRAGQARVRGEVRATVRPSDDGSIVEVASEVEVLGRMAALGAAPMRRRGDQVFDQFVRNIGFVVEQSHG